MQKINGAWNIAGLETIYEKDSLVPVTPNSSITIPAEQLAKFRPSYAHLSYTLSKEGHSVAENLPGIDKPEMVTKLYEDAEAWLIA